MKKLSVLALLICAVLVAFCVPVGAVRAENTATETDVKFVRGYDSYKLEYIVEKFDIILGEGEEVKAYKINDEEVINTHSYVFKSVGKNQTIEFFKDVEGTESLGSFTFEVVAKDYKGAIGYSLDAQKYAEYLEEVKDIIDSRKIDDNFIYPAITELLTSELYPVESLKLTLYYHGPKTKEFTSTTGKTIKLSELGSYSFYVLVQDPSGTTIEIDIEKHERKIVEANGVQIEGWYDENDKLIAPIFSFEVTNVRYPEIAILDRRDMANGFVGLIFKDLKDYFIVVSHNGHTSYSLYYSEIDLSQGNEYWSSSGVSIIEQSNIAVDITNAEEYLFDSETLEFLPAKKGYYYLVIKEEDDFGSCSAVTYPVVVEAEITVVKEAGCNGNINANLCTGVLAILACVFIINKKRSR